MAWYALYKWFRSFRKTPYVDMIQAYRKQLYDEWYNSLTDEQRDHYDEMLRRQREQDKASLDRSFVAMGNIFSHMYNRSHLPTMQDNYGMENAIRGLRSLVRSL